MKMFCTFMRDEYQNRENFDRSLAKSGGCRKQKGRGKMKKTILIAAALLLAVFTGVRSSQPGLVQPSGETSGRLSVSTIAPSFGTYL